MEFAEVTTISTLANGPDIPSTHSVYVIQEDRTHPGKLLIGTTGALFTIPSVANSSDIQVIVGSNITGENL